MSRRGRQTKRGRKKERDGKREANNAAHKQAGRGTDRLKPGRIKGDRHWHSK